MTTVYGDMQSGNCFKIALLFSNLGLACDWKPVSVVNGETRTDKFLSMNPAGQVPVVILDDGEVLTQSNAVLNYFAEGTSLLPAASLARARVLEWQFFEQYNHEPTIAVRRFIKKFLNLPADRKAEFDSKEEGAYRALNVMEKHLQQHKYLVDEVYSIADISLYAYTHVADEGDMNLSKFPAIRSWLDRVREQPGYIGMDAQP